MTERAEIQAFFDPATGTFSYVVWDGATRRAAVIDPVRDYDFRSGRTGTRALEPVLACLRANGLQVDWILETHVHADHLSAARHLQQLVGGRIAIGEHVRTVQETFRGLYNLKQEFASDGSQFDHLLAEGETFLIGGLTATAWLVPGHTPADMAYRVGDAVFVGDTLFMPDLGCARADFPGGDAHALYRSVRRLLDLPPQTLLCLCHDYPPPTRGPQWQTTVAEQRAHNIHAHDGMTEDEFVALRRARDATLDVPLLMLPSIQVNLRAGDFPPPEDNGVSYLRIPVDALPRRG